MGGDESGAVVLERAGADVICRGVELDAVLHAHRRHERVLTPGGRKRKLRFTVEPPACCRSEMRHCLIAALSVDRNRVRQYRSADRQGADMEV